MKFSLPKRRAKQDLNEVPEALEAPADLKERGKKSKIKKIKEKKPKGPKPKKVKLTSAAKIIKSYKIPSSANYILSIGDEGVILTYLKNKKVEGRWFAATPSEENFSVFSKAIAADSKAKMVIILDTMDQIYSQQTLPPVGKMSLPGLLKRRIKREFGDAVLKGSYMLERNSESKEWNFMLFAIEQREEVMAWLAWAAEQSVLPLGIRILPLEMTQLTEILYNMRPRAAEEAEANIEREWKFLVSYNKVSGYRQVIVRKGKMIFTRLSQPLEGAEDVQAGIIEQEVSSTIEYLKRIGLKTYQDIHLNILASEEMLKLLDMKKIGVPSYETLTPYTASQKFNWSEITLPEDRFGDVFLGVFSLVNKKSIAKLWTKPLDKLAKIYKISPLIRLIGLLIVLGAVIYMAISAYEWWESADEMDRSRLQNNQYTAELASLKETVNMPTEELDQALEMLDLYKNIKQNELTPKSFLLDLASAFSNMPKEMRVQSIDWNESMLILNPNAPPPQQDPNAPPLPTGKAVPIQGQLNVTISVPKGIKSEALNKRAQGIIEKLQSYFKYYKITLRDIPGANTTSDTLDIDLSKNTEDTENESFEELTLTIAFEGTEYIPELKFGK